MKAIVSSFIFSFLRSVSPAGRDIVESCASIDSFMRLSVTNTFNKGVNFNNGKHFLAVGLPAGLPVLYTWNKASVQSEAPRLRDGD